MFLSKPHSLGFVVCFVDSGEMNLNACLTTIPGTQRNKELLYKVGVWMVDVT